MSSKPRQFNKKKGKRSGSVSASGGDRSPNSEVSDAAPSNSGKLANSQQGDEIREFGEVEVNPETVYGDLLQEQLPEVPVSAGAGEQNVLVDSVPVVTDCQTWYHSLFACCGGSRK